MRTIAQSQVMASAFELMGESFADAQEERVVALVAHLNRRVRQGWEAYPWPELCRIEERFFAALYDNAIAYVAGDVVRYTPPGEALGYYRALGATTGNVPTDTAWWELVGSEWVPTVGFEQDGEEPIGECLQAWSADPRISRRAFEVPFVVTDRGIEFWRTPMASVWLRYRLRPSTYSARVWDATRSEVPGALVYYVDSVTGDGDTWRCVAAAAAGESPATHPAKWEKIAFPYVLATFASFGAFRDLLKSDGQTDKSLVEEREVRAHLEDAIEQIESQQSQGRGFRVATRAVY